MSENLLKSQFKVHFVPPERICFCFSQVLGTLSVWTALYCVHSVKCLDVRSEGSLAGTLHED